MSKIVIIFKTNITIFPPNTPAEQVFVEVNDEQGNSIDAGEWASDGEYETLTIDCDKFATK